MCTRGWVDWLQSASFIRRKLFGGMFLAEILKRENNNFDLYRLVAACMVIWGHAYALLPNPQGQDFIARFTGFTYSGALAVVLFFFLSGLLVANSLIAGVQFKDFIVNRLARIWPGLFCSVALITFVFGPLVTNLPIADYFASDQLWRSFVANVSYGPFLNLQDWNLPGVFRDHKYTATNGSMWTIPYELCAYSTLLAGFVLFRKHRDKISLLASAILVTACLKPSLGLLPDSEINMAIAAFSLGVSACFYKDKILINLPFVLSITAFAFVARATIFSELSFLLAAITFSVWLSSLRVVRSVKLPGDYSFGVYLYGFPVQQMLISFGFSESTIANQLLTIVLAVVLALGSWHFVEKPSQKYIKAGFAKLLNVKNQGIVKA